MLSCLFEMSKKTRESERKREKGNEQVKKGSNVAEPTKLTKKYQTGIIVCKLVFSVCFTTFSLSLTCRSFVNNNSNTLLRLYFSLRSNAAKTLATI